MFTAQAEVIIPRSGKICSIQEKILKKINTFTMDSKHIQVCVDVSFAVYSYLHRK